jgi:nuclear GTP-binding protein
MSLIRDDEKKTKNGIKIHKAKMVIEASSFGETFGPKAQRKRVKMGLGSFADLAGETVKMHDHYLDRLEEVKLLSGQTPLKDENGDLEDEEVDEGTSSGPREPIFSKGQSKRIWNELYKVMDSSDVIAHVLDARDPLGTRCKAVEKYLKEEAPHKHLVFILNKVSLLHISARF